VTYPSTKPGVISLPLQDHDKKLSYEPQIDLYNSAGPWSLRRSTSFKVTDYGTIKSPYATSY